MRLGSWIKISSHLNAEGRHTIVSEWVSQRKRYSLMNLLFSWNLQFMSFNNASMINGLSPYIAVTALCWMRLVLINHADVIKWKHFQRYWPFVRGIQRSPVNSPHKGQWRGALMFSLICARINGWVNNSEAGDLKRHRAHYDVSVMPMHKLLTKTLRGHNVACT